MNSKISEPTRQELLEVLRERYATASKAEGPFRGQPTAQVGHCHDPDVLAGAADPPHRHPDGYRGRAAATGRRLTATTAATQEALDRPRGVSRASSFPA